ncbi:MAG: hypothetical protein JNN15_04295 [Blastocatellia bacterium]|nr:hypothetical protein [Blastocatellia bacterium]
MYLKSRLLIVAIFLLCLSQFAEAQDTIKQKEAELKKFFEGKTVVINIDMPATKDGIDIYPEREVQVDYSEYSNRIREHGRAVRKGDEILITKIKINKKNIEFQLGGGGYGVAGDDTGYVSPRIINKSSEEDRLEKELKNETDPERRRRLQREIDFLRDRRERENRIYQEDARRQTAINKDRIRDKALDAGSRFNIWYEKGVKVEQLTPETILGALGEFVTFENRSISKPGKEKRSRSRLDDFIDDNDE